MAGWIKIHRDIASHWIFQDAEKFKWWIDLLLAASHEDVKTLVGGRLIEVKRGQLIASLEYLAKRWSVSKRTVLKFMQLLESDGMCNRCSNRKVTIVTICNYDSYQAKEEVEVTDVVTDKYPIGNRLVTENKNAEECKEINNNNLNARTREERVPWNMEREASLKAAFKANGNAMALSRETKLSASSIFEYLDRFMDACQIGNRGHNDIGHFGNDFRNFVKDPKNKPTQPKKKVISNEDLYREMYG